MLTRTIGALVANHIAAVTCQSHFFFWSGSQTLLRWIKTFIEKIHVAQI